MSDSGGQMWRATFAWRGTNYAGWQLQTNAETIQARIEAALSAICGVEERVPAQASGRTDAGVHAEMQIVSFRLPVERMPHQVVAGLNYHLPDDIVCLSADKTVDDFSPRQWTKEKLYRYRILNRGPICPFRTDYVWHIQQPLDVASMDMATTHLIGQHDYSSFRAAGCSANTPLRRILDARAYARADNELSIEFTGHGFLRHQIRIMVGTLVDVGTGKITPDRVGEIRDAHDRLRAGTTAPAKGLVLVRVDLLAGPRQYDDD